jgi:CheY-like chemotaxis protein
LLTQDRPHSEQHWTSQLPRLLEPQGVASYLVGTGREAVDLAERMEFHAAVIDMSTPIGPEQRGVPGPHGHVGPGDGFWVLEVLRRLPSNPPVVILRKPAFSQRQAERTLNVALRLGAFTVLKKPVDVEQVLAVFQRLVDKRYRGAWPPG